MARATAFGANAKRRGPTHRLQKGRGGTDRAPVQSTRGCSSCNQATVFTCGVGIIGGSAAPLRPTEVRLPSGGRGPLAVQAECCLPGLLRRELLGPRAHQCCGPRVAGVALERIAPEKG